VRGLSITKSALALFLAAWLQGCASGPSLGPAQKVVITGRGGEKPDDAGCRNFQVSLRDAKRFLNHAHIVTPSDLNDDYDWFPCYVTGTAEFRGSPAEWRIRPGGTGSITFWNEFTFSIADEKQKTSD
jgi:hypothetical protein